MYFLVSGELLRRKEKTAYIVEEEDGRVLLSLLLWSQRLNVSWAEVSPLSSLDRERYIGPRPVGGFVAKYLVVPFSLEVRSEIS